MEFFNWPSERLKPLGIMAGKFGDVPGVLRDWAP